jgi:hypothetical protein
VIKRYQIQDIIAQDASGIVFHALDTETHAAVAVRRFFPFGADGGGLQGEQQIAYEIAIARLAGIHHPGLRAVISGGCDPVDGMPFVATEWIEGETLRIHRQGKPLGAADVIQVLTRAMDVCELLSLVLAEEGIWVETELDSIIVGREDGGRGVTFWIAPLKWLGRGEEDRDFQSIITLTEELMGWQGETVNDQAGRGLGGWLRWLRGASATTSLNEAREMLAAATGLEPPTPTQHLVREATRPMVAYPVGKTRKKPMNGQLITIIMLCLVMGGLLGWVFYQRAPSPQRARGGLAELAAELAAEEAARASAPIDEAGSNTGVFAPEDPRLLAQENREVVVEGVLRKIDFSPPEDFMFLQFSDPPTPDSTRGSVLVSAAGPGVSKPALERFVGQKIRLRGKVLVQRKSGTERADITFTDRAAIEVAE